MKNKELINDSRLTPTMERVRSGAIQMFREKDPDNRSFIRKDNADVILVHKKRSMYSELIDGEWYWVEGCAECNGEPRDWMTYVECDEHNRCSICETNTKDLAEGVTKWGNKEGWICGTCMDERKAETRRLAFEKYRAEDPDEWDFSYMDKLRCPHCGSNICDDEIYSN